MGAFNTSWDGDVIPNIFTRGKAENFSVYCVANCCRTGSRTNYWWLFVDQMSWRWAFYINLPFGIMALLFGLLFLKEHIEKSAGRFDYLGFVFSAPGFAMLIYALSQGPSRGWISTEVISTGIAGVVFITLFIIVELKVKQPMLDLRLFKEPVFRKMSLISLFSSAGLLGMLFVFPLMYQNVIGVSALESGLTTFPEAIGLMISSQIVPWSYKKLGARKVISIGLICNGDYLYFIKFCKSRYEPLANTGIIVWHRYFLRPISWSSSIFCI